MNLKEIILINQALDGKQIFSLPDFSKHKMTNLVIYALKDKLIQQELLSDDQKFTEKGLKLAKRIYDFKRSKKYIKIGDLTIGLYEGNTGVLLKRNRVKDQYDFERINMRECVTQIIDAYPFLGISCTSSYEAIDTDMSYDKLNKQYPLDMNNSIHISTFELKDQDEVTTNEMIFDCDDQLYLYDMETSNLYMRSNIEVHNLLGERMLV